MHEKIEWRAGVSQFQLREGLFFEVQGMKFNLNESRPAGERFIGFDVDFAL